MESLSESFVMWDVDEINPLEGDGVGVGPLGSEGFQLVIVRKQKPIATCVFTMEELAQVREAINKAFESVLRTHTQHKETIQ